MNACEIFPMFYITKMKEYLIYCTYSIYYPALKLKNVENIQNISVFILYQVQITRF